MQQKERKGAWVLFVIILIFGAIVFGYGQCRRIEARKILAEQSLNRPDTLALNQRRGDNVDVTLKKGKSKKKRNKKSRKSKYYDGHKEKVRDILADTIPVR